MEAEISCPSRNTLGDIFLFSFYVKIPRRPHESVETNLRSQNISLFPVSLFLPEGSMPNHEVLLAFPFLANLPNPILTVTYKDSRLCVSVHVCVYGVCGLFWFFFFRSNSIFPSFRLLSSSLPDHRHFNQRPSNGRDESLPGIFESPSCDHILVVPLPHWTHVLGKTAGLQSSSS